MSSPHDDDVDRTLCTEALAQRKMEEEMSDMDIRTVANAGSGMVLGRESNGGCSRYSAPHFGLSTSSSRCCRLPSDFIQDRWWSSRSIFKHNASWLLPQLFCRIQRLDDDTG